MGMFDFIKSAGKKLFGASEAKAASADELKKEVASHGFDASKLDIQVNGNSVSVSGAAGSTEEAERIILALGNTIGVAQVNSDIIAEGAQARMHTVAKGENLWKIAEKYLGNGSRYPEIVAANSPPIKNPDLIQPGWVLRIPNA